MDQRTLGENASENSITIAPDPIEEASALSTKVDTGCPSFYAGRIR